ncbi:MAG TPA: hypothetical protein ENI87_08265 [bacterium]|nr:hypothetical protein [bacterium]
MRLDRVVTGMLLALAIFWIGASAFVRGDGVPDWWLPAALAGGLFTGLATGRGEPAATSEPTPRWASWTLAALVAVAFAALAYGAVATPSRHWDGAASFDAKVFWLTRAPTLQQPFFEAAGVFHHGPDYPLLQALLVAMAERLAPGFGRLVLAMLYLLLVGVAAAALRPRAMPPLVRVALTGCLALTPALLTPGGGAADSGYSEVALLVATTTIAGGLLNRSTLWFGLGIGLAVVTKPEGAIYAVAAVAVAFVGGNRRLLVAGFAGLLVALGTWSPVRAVLLHQPSTSLWWQGLAGATLACWAALAATERLPRPAVGRWALALAAPLALLLALPVIAPWFAPESAIGVYMRQAARWHQGLANLPDYLAAMLAYGITRLRLGLTFVVPLAALAIARARRAPLAAGGVGAFLGFGLVSTALPFVLSPEPDLQHHLRSSLPRLLLHWIGPAWLLTAALLQPWHDQDPPRT